MKRAGNPSIAARLSVARELFEVRMSQVGISRLVLPEIGGEVTASGPEPFTVDNRVTGWPEVEWLSRLGSYLHDILAGTEPGSGPPVDLNGLSDFTVEVLGLVSEIPWGSRRSYGWVAEEMGKPSAARAVGGALGRNPVPILVPCHRVVREDGSLGGFSGPKGWKELLLELEGRSV